MSTVWHTVWHRTRKVYYRRVHIPRNLRQHFNGRLEVWRSLKTADQEEAGLRAAQFDTTTRKLFLALKRQGDRMSTEQVEALVEQWLETELDSAEDDRALAGLVSEARRESQLDGLDFMPTRI